MNLFDSALLKIENYVLNRTSDSKIRIEAANRGGNSDNALSNLIEKQSTTLQEKSLQDLKRAILAASSPDQPEWSQLYQIHENLLIDDHLASVIDSRILHAKRTSIKFVDDAGKENKDVTQLFERPWFEDLIEIVIGTRFRGRRLIELYDLNEDGELETITEIKQPWFNSKLGIITKNPGETTGWNYREGIYANYYLQVGKSDNLGMLSQMAPIVLAKKLGMGSWLDFIDKYGVPPLFITTDREDSKRLEQLWNAASKFKSNNFMVGRGQEKFEVGDVSGAGVDPFEKLALRADNMMSKRVLGGTGLTDEKGFVGSVDIQYKLAKDRFESDKLFFKYVFNAYVRPRLVALSPVYAPLKTYKLDWDNSESLSVEAQVDLIVKLGDFFDIDPTFIQNLTGIPILGIKDNSAITETKPKGDNPGKK
ncbi:MAG: hypothetical protein IE931_03400 [Sphingobacteriales bacterium]|nr:hypothetical protein [Sphingobacteriales bacterium]